LSGTMVVNGSPTKTEISDEAGSRTQWTNIVAAIVVLFVLLFLTRPLSYLPDAALSALVFTIGVKLVDIKSMRQIFKQSKIEFFIALLGAVVVIVWGAAQGIIFSMVLAFILHVRISFHPHNSLLVPSKAQDGSIVWVWKKISSNAQAEPGRMVYHFAAFIYYANVDVFTEEITDLLEANPNVQELCFDFSAINDVDFTGGQTLHDFFRKLISQGIHLELVEVAPHVMDQLSDYGIMTAVGPENVYPEMVNALRR